MSDFQTKARELVSSLQKHVRLDRAYDPHISDDAEEDIASALAAAYEQGKRDGAEQERNACALVAKHEIMRFRSRFGGRYSPGYHENMRDTVAAAIRKRGEA